MADITITKMNELYVNIEAEPYVFYELRDVFSFRPAGYKFMPQFKSGMWDGKIYLIDVKRKLLYTGLLPELFEWSKKSGYTIKIDNSCGDFLHKFNHVEYFLDNWAEWCKFEPYDYQLNAVETSARLNKCLILSPTGSGKSLICYSMVSYLMKYTNYRILITVPTTQLVEQLCNDFANYQPENFEITQHVHKIYGGKDKDTTSRIVISTWQSMFRQPKEYFSMFDAYICDEAHQADGKSISTIIDNLSATSKIRIGMTGTLDGTKCHMMQLKGLFGPIVKTKTTKELMDGGNLSKLKINVRILKYKNKFDEAAVVKQSYKGEIDYIVGNKKRLDDVVNTSMTCKGNTLVLFNFVDNHGKPLYNRALEVQSQFNKESYFIHGGISVEERELIRHKFETQDNIVLFASFGTFSAGINAPNIRNLILAHPTKARIRTLQSIGRALRKSTDKEFATLIDYADDLFPSAKKRNSTYNHLLERLDIYENEHFNYNITTVEFDN